MSEEQVLLYVRAAAAALELPLDDEAAQRVAGHLLRTSAMARMLDGADMAPDDELAEIYKPAPWPAEKP